MNKFNRRTVLRSLGLTAGASLLTGYGGDPACTCAYGQLPSLRPVEPSHKWGLAHLFQVAICSRPNV